MLTTYDKALAAFLVPLIMLANQKWGITLPADPEIVTALIAALTGAVVWAVPNKGSGA